MHFVFVYLLLLEHDLKREMNIVEQTKIYCLLHSVKLCYCAIETIHHPTYVFLKHYQLFQHICQLEIQIECIFFSKLIILRSSSNNGLTIESK